MLPYKFSSSGDYDKNEEGENMAKQTQLQETRCRELGSNSLLSENTSFQQPVPFPKLWSFDDFCSSSFASPFQFCHEEHNIPSKIPELIAPEEEKPLTSFFPSFGILNNFNTKPDDEIAHMPNDDIAFNKVGSQALSINEFIRLAGENFILSSSLDQLTEHDHRFLTSLSGLSDEETRSVEAIQALLASAEKVGQQQFDHASKILSRCDGYSSSKGNPVQKLVYYFSSALRNRIELETEGNTSKALEKIKPVEMEGLSHTSPTILKLHQQVPFCQVCQFAGINAIIENVALAKKIHIIDLQIKNGSQCTIFMQALAVRHECPVEHLKITAVGTESRTELDETGARLISFAETMNLSFSFNVVMVADMLDLHRDLFELEVDESVAVYSSFFLHIMILQKDRLENLMKVIKSMKPCVMVVNEIEANLNSPDFVNRFIEVLFFNGAFFDCLEDCMSHDDPDRDILESTYFASAIQNVAAAEGDERTIRVVKTDVWRKFFAQFGVIQKNLSSSSLYQASLVTKNFDCGSSCSLYMDGETLIVGWKGTPLLSVTAWIFL